GAEIALWIWQQYEDTGSISFLQKYYPLLQQTATFLLAWQSVGSDGYLHSVDNAHETQWAVQDPVTDQAADQALFTATASAAPLPPHPTPPPPTSNSPRPPCPPPHARPARLDLASEVANDLVNSTKSYQIYPSGLAAWNPGTLDEPYIEQVSNVATTLDEALATDYDGTLRFAPAWPAGWDASGTVYIQGGSKVDVQVEGGT